MTNADDPLVPIAFDVFSRLGIKKGTMADVAAAAGVSRQTVYNRFANKDEVLRATTKYLVAKQIQQMQNDWETSQTLADKIEAFYRAAPIFWYDTIRQTPDAAALIEGIYAAAAEEMAQGNIEWCAALAHMFQDYGRHLGDAGLSPKEAADFLYASAHSAKTDVSDRPHLLRRLATLKAAVLALVDQGQEHAMAKHADNIIPLYRQHSAEWMTSRSQTLFEKAWLDKFLGLMPSTASVLDIGCGSGEPIGRYLTTTCRDVTGIDASPELIAIAQDRLPDARWITVDMRGLDLQRKFDGILAWNSSFHLTPDDQRSLFAVFARHAKPGAALMFTSGTEHGTVRGEFAGKPLYHASLDPTEYQRLLAAHGFELVDHVARDPDCGYHTIWLAHYTGA